MSNDNNDMLLSWVPEALGQNDKKNSCGVREPGVMHRVDIFMK